MYKKKSDVFSSIFLKLTFEDWKSTVKKMSESVGSKCKTREISNSEFYIGLVILIGAAEFARRGCDLFSVKDGGQ